MIAVCLLLALASEADFVETRLEVPTDGTRLALRDMDGDGRADLVWVSYEGVGVSFLREDGRYPDEVDAHLAWPSANLAWDLADLDSDGATELVALVDAKRVVSWSVGREAGFGEGRPVLREVQADLPRGRRHIGFARDVDGDGDRDVVVPASGRYRIHLNADGKARAWRDPIEVLFEPDISFQTGSPSRLDRTFGVSIRIPWFSLEDFDGDGLTDLISETDDSVQFHLASPELPSEPTWRLDKAALREAGGGPGTIDFQDLFAVLGQQVNWRIADLDGEGAADLIVQQGSTFRVYLEGSRTGNARRPDSLLKSGGRVLTFLLKDLDGDGRVELLMVRAEKISLGRVVRWLVLPGSLDFDIFAYRNEGGAFSRKPASRVALRFKIPRLLSFLDELDEVGDELSAGLDFPTTVGSFDGDGVFDDVVDIVGDEILVFRNCAPDSLGIDWRNVDELDIGGMIEGFLSDQIEGLEDGDVATLDLGDLANIDFSPAEELRTAYAGREPDLRMPLSVRSEKVALQVADVDGDGRSDLILFQDKPEGTRRPVQVLVTR